MKHLGRHLERLRACFARLPDPRRGRNRQYAMRDVGMAALSVFLMQSPSFLAHQRALAEQRGRSNAHTLFGLSRIPCDNHIRQLLDGVPPAHFDGEFHGLVEDLRAHGGLEPMRRLDGRLLIALDGTQYFHSRRIHCPNCSIRQRKDGTTEYSHQMLAATLVAPGQAQTLPLPPAFVRPRDGALKQDCERRAAKRWPQRHGARRAPLRPVYLGDDLYACQPVCRAMLDSGGDFLLTCKPDSHKTLYEYLDGVDLPTRHGTSGRGAQRRIHRYRWMTDLPVRDGDDALRANWFDIAISRRDGTVTYYNAFVTSLDVYACQPVCRAMLDSGGDFLLICKPDSHKTLYEYLDGVDPPTRHGTSGRGAQRRIHRYRWMTGLPVRDGDDALRANWFDIASSRPDGTVTYRGTFVTSLDVGPDNVAELAARARTRWKIENETFNVLKQHGYHLEHNFGHGKDTLASVLVVLNLLAFAMRAACELTETLWQRARRRLGARVRLFEHMRAITCYQVFPSWTALLSLLATGGPQAQPP